ncbi:MAG: serine/threonine protein kinase [Deltaproteobacteria bacterium]|nr:serine/threonine protein kinase [Deltaproteobacteria bacterium]
MRLESGKRRGTAPLLLGGYEVHGAIAAGGMAVVHLGRALATGRVVAVKRLRPELAEDPSFVAMFLDEARLASQIVHENVVRTLDVVEDGAESYIVMEYIEGETLARLMRTYAPPPFDVIARVLLDLLHGLHAAHVARGKGGEPLGVIHRDVSPQNLLVDVEGRARVIDFGVAKAHGRSQLTRDGEVKGKLGYMAPEQLEGRPITVHSDIYAAGVVLWEMLTGKRLFGGDSEGAVVLRILRGEVTPPTEMWRRHARHTLSFFAQRQLELLDAVTMRALALDPSRRFDDAAAMATALAEALPASPRSDVGFWVQNAARDLLASRSVVLAQMEESSGVGPRGIVSGASVRPASLHPALEEGRMPVIVADLVSRETRDAIARAAEQGDIVHVHLLTAPVEPGEHVLELHVVGEEGPSLFRATPAGAVTSAGCPLRVGPHGDLELTDERPTEVGAPRGAADLVGRQIARGTLILEACIGAGGGGTVYRARHRERREHVVAVKVMHVGARGDARFRRRFHEEALAASKLDHANIVRVLDYGEEADGLLHLTMPLIEGESLRERLKKSGPMPIDDARNLMLQLCAALAHAHERGVIHRDVKPANVILVHARDDDGRDVEIAKVCDFGIATERSPEHEIESSLRAAGTVEYMSPEQCRGDEVDARSDVYSCGIVLFELVTGRRPFRGRSRSELVSQHLSASPPLPSKYLGDDHPRLDALVHRMLAKDPANRPASMAELRRELRGL